MRILVVGSGGREHALAWKLSQEAEVICAPGNAGICDAFETVDIPASDTNRIVSLAIEEDVDLVVVGPEDPLVHGLADALRGQGIPTFGPGRKGAMLEASKAFSKEFMAKANVPTAAFSSFQNPDLAKEYVRKRFDQGFRLAIKASGNALGKGVIVTDTVEQALSAVDELHALGEAGRTLVVEDRLRGREFSLLTICSGLDYKSLPVAQDHKRVGENDTGPNTGGMGTFSPIPEVDDALIAETERTVVAPILRQLHEEGIDYRGVLFSGLMLHDGRPHCLEYNVRFGDPETQSVMLRLGRGFAAALLAAAKGESIPPIETVSNAAATVVICSAGYPGPIEKGIPITLSMPPKGAMLFHAGTAFKKGQLVTSGGRVIGASAQAATLAEAVKLAYEAAKSVRFEGAFFRQDIGTSL